MGIDVVDSRSPYKDFGPIANSTAYNCTGRNAQGITLLMVYGREKERERQRQRGKMCLFLLLHLSKFGDKPES